MLWGPGEVLKAGQGGRGAWVCPGVIASVDHPARPPPPPAPRAGVDTCLHAAERPRWKFMVSGERPPCPGFRPIEGSAEALNKSMSRIYSINHEPRPPPAPQRLSGFGRVGSRNSLQGKRGWGGWRGLGSVLCPPLERDGVSGVDMGAASPRLEAHLSPCRWGVSGTSTLSASHPDATPHPTSLPRPLSDPSSADGLPHSQMPAFPVAPT